MKFNPNINFNFQMNNMNMLNPNNIQMNQRTNCNQNQMINSRGNMRMFNQNNMQINQNNNMNQNMTMSNRIMNNNSNIKNNQNFNNPGNIKGNNIINNFPQNNMINNNINNNMFNCNINNNMINNNINNNMINNNISNNNNMNNNINSNNNNNNQNNLKHLKKQLLKSSLSLKDPFKIQMSIALGLNNNQPYEHYVQGGIQVPDFMKQSSNENPNGIMHDDKINVIFVVMKGNSHSRIFNKNDTIRDMLVKFIKSCGLQEYHLKFIYFLFNAVNLNTINQNQTLKDFGIRNGSKITILDLQDIIGA